SWATPSNTSRPCWRPVPNRTAGHSRPRSRPRWRPSLKSTRTGICSSDRITCRSPERPGRELTEARHVAHQQGVVHSVHVAWTDRQLPPTPQGDHVLTATRCVKLLDGGNVDDVGAMYPQKPVAGQTLLHHRHLLTHFIYGIMQVQMYVVCRCAHELQRIEMHE